MSKYARGKYEISCKPVPSNQSHDHCIPPKISAGKRCPPPFMTVFHSPHHARLCVWLVTGLLLIGVQVVYCTKAPYMSAVALAHKLKTCKQLACLQTRRFCNNSSIYIQRI